MRRESVLSSPADAKEDGGVEAGAGGEQAGAVQDVQTLLLARVKELVLELDDCTPEVIIFVD